MTTLLVILGFLCFVLGIFDVWLGAIKMVSLGLALTTAATLIGALPKAPQG